MKKIFLPYTNRIQKRGDPDAHFCDPVSKFECQVHAKKIPRMKEYVKTPKY